MESLDQLQTPPTADEKNIALLTHLGSLFFGFIVPLVIFLVKKDDSEFVREHAKEALNFQISMLIYLVGSALLMIIVIGMFLMIGLAIFFLVTTIMASVAASSGKHYKYPLCIRMIS